MSQHDLNIANQGFPAFRADLNDALVALGSTNSGATAPATTYANQLWYDTANNILKIRNEDNDAWISLFTLNQTADTVSEIATAIATLGAGSASNPSLTTAGDTNTGIFFPAADTIAFAEGGVEVMRIDSSGNILIGTTSAAAGKLAIKGDANTLWLIGRSADGTSSVSFRNNADSAYNARIESFDTGVMTFGTGTSATERMRIDSTGRAIIGHTASVGTAIQTNMQVKGSGSSNYAGYGLITSNNESAGFFGVNSNGENSLVITSDPDNLRVGSRIVFAVDGTDQMQLGNTGFLQFNSGYGSPATAYGCRAWINFDGRSSIPVRASGNISSIGDNGTGSYTINFATAMPDANYSVSGMASDVGGTGNRGLVSIYTGVAAPAAGSFRIFTFADSTATDNSYINLAVFR